MPLVTSDFFSKLFILKSGLNISIKSKVWNEVVNLMSLWIIWFPCEKRFSVQLNEVILIIIIVIIITIIISSLHVHYWGKIWLWIPICMFILNFTLRNVLLSTNDIVFKSKVWHEVISWNLWLFNALIFQDPFVLFNCFSPIEAREALVYIWISAEVWNKIVNWMRLWKFLLGLNNPLVFE